MCVLLVEDNPLIRMLLAEELRDAGFDVVEAITGDKAIDLIENSLIVFTALVTDLHMPGRTNGAGVAALMREKWPSIPVIIASGRPDVFKPIWEQDLDYTLLSKPFATSKLVKMVQDLTGKRDAVI